MNYPQESGPPAATGTRSTTESIRITATATPSRSKAPAHGPGHSRTAKQTHEQNDRDLPRRVRRYPDDPDSSPRARYPQNLPKSQVTGWRFWPTSVTFCLHARMRSNFQHVTSLNFPARLFRMCQQTEGNLHEFSSSDRS